MLTTTPLHRGSANAHLFRNPELQELADLAFDLGAVLLTYLPASEAASMGGVITTTGLYLGLNSASPGQTGANELTPGTAYSGNRPGITWSSYTAGVTSNTALISFTLSATQAGGIPYISIWTASTGGTYLGGGPTTGLSGSIPSGAQVSFAISNLTLTVTG